MPQGIPIIGSNRTPIIPISEGEKPLPSEDGEAKLPTTKKRRFSTYVIFGGLGMFLLGSLGFWIVRDKPDRKKLQRFGRTLAITGILIRGVGEIVALREKKKA